MSTTALTVDSSLRCGQCKKAFKTARATAQHCADTGHQGDQYTPPTPPSTPPSVKRRQQKQPRSFPRRTTLKSPSLHSGIAEAASTEGPSTSFAKKGSHHRRPRTTLMFPDLHSRVAEAVSAEIPSAYFVEKGSEGRPMDTCGTHVMGKFKCDDKNRCSNVWTSKVVPMVISRYPRNGYSAEVFKQRCKRCERLGVLTLDEDSYVDRVTYRIKRWAGVGVETPPFSINGGPPHRSDLCEGCKRGVCRLGSGGGVF